MRAATPRWGQEFMCAWAEANGLDPSKVAADGLAIEGSTIVYDEAVKLSSGWALRHRRRAPLVISQEDFEKTWGK